MSKSPGLLPVSSLTLSILPFMVQAQSGKAVDNAARVSAIPTAMLANGVKMPVLCLSTFTLTGNMGEKSVATTLALEYRRTLSNAIKQKTRVNTMCRRDSTTTTRRLA